MNDLWYWLITHFSAWFGWLTDHQVDLHAFALKIRPFIRDPATVFVALFIAFRARMFTNVTKFAKLMTAGEYVLAVIFVHSIVARYTGYAYALEVSTILTVVLLYYTGQSTVEMIRRKGGLRSMIEDGDLKRNEDYKPLLMKTPVPPPELKDEPIPDPELING